MKTLKAFAVKNDDTSVHHLNTGELSEFIDLLGKGYSYKNFLLSLRQIVHKTRTLKLKCHPTLLSYS